MSENRQKNKEKAENQLQTKEQTKAEKTDVPQTQKKGLNQKQLESKERLKKQLEWIERNPILWNCIQQSYSWLNDDLEAFHKVLSNVMDEEDPCFEMIPILLVETGNILFSGTAVDNAILAMLLDAWDDVNLQAGVDAAFLSLRAKYHELVRLHRRSQSK